MIGLTENLKNELKELLTDSKISVIDVFEIIKSLIDDKEALKIIDELIEVGLLNEDDLFYF